MLKINHPAALVRDRQKNVTNWESVQLRKYANGVEVQILVGNLPHGELQSAISANRAITIVKEGSEATISFGDTPTTLVDFLNGDRLKAETESARVLDSCHFLPSTQVDIQVGDQTGKLAQDGGLLVAAFADGTRVEVEPHGGHGHVHAKRGDTTLKCFFNGQENKLFVFGAE